MYIYIYIKYTFKLRTVYFQASYCNILSSLTVYTFRPHSVCFQALCSILSKLIVYTFRPHSVYFQAS